MTDTSLKPVIGELESLFDTFNGAFFEKKLERPVITVSPRQHKGRLWVVYRVEGLAGRDQRRRVL